MNFFAGLALNSDIYFVPMDTWQIENLDLFPSVYLRFTDPTDYFEYALGYKSLQELIDHVKTRREAMNFEPLFDYSLVIQEYLYYLNEAPRTHFVKRPLPDSSRSFKKDIYTAARLAASLFSDTGIFVDKTEANRRAKICSQCPLNLLKNKNFLTRFNDKLLQLGTSYRTTDYDDRLKDCSVCECPLESKVHFSPQAIKQANKDYTASHFPEAFKGLDNKKHSCWMIPILEEK